MQYDDGKIDILSQFKYEKLPSNSGYLKRNTNWKQNANETYIKSMKEYNFKVDKIYIYFFIFLFKL